MNSTKKGYICHQQSQFPFALQIDLQGSTGAIRISYPLHKCLVRKSTCLPWNSDCLFHHLFHVPHGLLIKNGKNEVWAPNEQGCAYGRLPSINIFDSFPPWRTSQKGDFVTWFVAHPVYSAYTELSSQYRHSCPTLSLCLRGCMTSWARSIRPSYFFT